MRTIIIILLGLVLFAVFMTVAKLFTAFTETSKNNTLYVFAGVWFIAAAINMWIGVLHGYGFLEELPIFIILFVVPVAIAKIVRWKFI